MPNKPDPDKTLMSFRLPRTLHARLKRLAQERGCSVSDIVVMCLSLETLNVVLTPEDYEKIAKETRQAESRLGTYKN